MASLIPILPITGSPIGETLATSIPAALCSAAGQSDHQRGARQIASNPVAIRAACTASDDAP
jgi:hypothetical protein